MAFKLTNIELELEAYGLKLLKPYEGSMIPLIYLCTCGGIGRTRLDNIRRQSRCGFCKENNWRSQFLDRGDEILEYKSNREIKYRCSCGNIHTCHANNWLNNHAGCPKCKIRYNFNPNKILRPNLYSWKLTLLERDNFECRKCECSDNLQAHHIEAYYARPDLASCLDNGIILCYDCHIELHKLYGWNVGIGNLDKELSNYS